MQVKDLIQSPVTTCSIETDVAAARDLMKLKNFSALPVVALTDGKPDLKGIISYQDLAGVYDDHINVRQIMTTKVKCIKPEASLKEAAQLMVEEGIHHLVVKDDQVHGIISSFDFVKMVAQDRLN